DRRTPERTLAAFARRGRLRADPGQDRLLVELEHGELQTLSPDRRTFRQISFERYGFDLDVRDLLGRRLAVLGGADTFDADSLRRIAGEVRGRGEDPWRYELALHRKYALPAAALVFAILAVAVGLGRVRAPRLRAALLAVGMVALYYALLRAGDGLAARGAIPVEIAAWLPNLVLFPIALGALGWRARSRG